MESELAVRLKEKQSEIQKELEKLKTEEVSNTQV